MLRGAEDAEDLAAASRDCTSYRVPDECDVLPLGQGLVR
jgi:hypothetical protein